MQIKGFHKDTMPLPGEVQSKQVRGEGKNTPFMDKLEHVEKKLWQGKLDSLLEKVQAQGNVLAKNRNLRELKRYKNLVKAFMEEAVHNSLELKQNSCWNPRGKHRMLVIVETVDERIQELTQLMLEEEEKTFKILEKLDEIRGMLLDLYT